MTKQLNTNLSTVKNFTREDLAKKIFQLTKAILDANITKEEALRLINTQYGYLGTNNMTMEQLRETHETLYNNYHSLSAK